MDFLRDTNSRMKNEKKFSRHFFLCCCSLPSTIHSGTENAWNIFPILRSHTFFFSFLSVTPFLRYCFCFASTDSFGLFYFALYFVNIKYLFLCRREKRAAKKPMSMLQLSQICPYTCAAYYEPKWKRQNLWPHWSGTENKSLINVMVYGH